MLTGAGRTLTWTSFNLPRAITSCPGNVAANCKTTSFLYNPEHERTIENQADGSMVVTLSPRYDTGLHFEKRYLTDPATQARTGAVEYEHYLYAGGLMFGKFIQNTAVDGVTIASTSYEYYTKDHLGSIVALTDGTGAVLQRLSYDVWGKRRYPNGAADPNGLLNNPDMYHGYTGHEMLDDVGLIHMNGRLYDPMMARFVSADPNIPNPENLLSYSRYTYCLDNPLACTDPSGYFDLGDVFKLAAVVAVGYFMAPIITQSVFTSIINPIMATGSITTAQAVGAWTVASAASGAAVGFTSSMIMTGGDVNASLQGGALGALSGGLFGLAGISGGAGSAANYAAHAGAGCVIGMANGNGCGRGAAAELASKWATVYTNGDFIGTVVAGGTVSVIGGGKFANGAVTAAYGWAYNNCSTDCNLLDKAKDSVEKFIQGVKSRLTVSWRLRAGYGFGVETGPVMPYSAGIPKRGSQVDVNPGVGEAFGASHSLTVDVKVYSTNTMVSGNPVAVTTTLCGGGVFGMCGSATILDSNLFSLTLSAGVVNGLSFTNTVTKPGGMSITVP